MGHVWFPHVSADQCTRPDTKSAESAPRKRIGAVCAAETSKGAKYPRAANAANSTANIQIAAASTIRNRLEYSAISGVCAWGRCDSPVMQTLWRLPWSRATDHARDFRSGVR